MSDLSLFPSSPSKRSYLRLLVLQVEKVYDALHRFLAWITGRLGKPMTAEVYHAAPVSTGIAVKGRVLLNREWREPDPDDPAWLNLIQMLKRWATPERPNSLVRISHGDEVVEVRADREGYFEVVLPDEGDSAELLHIEFPESEVSPPISHEVLDSSQDPDCLIISDVDDTVLVTHAATRLRMIATTLFGNALTRQLFPGAPELYQALQRGKEAGGPRNPIAYVTSSPYNLHGLLQLIFEENGLPLGLFFMNDWGLEVEHWFKKSHRDHKLAAIEQALKWYPEKPVILIGDSGQHDTAIYLEVARTCPERVSQILIRAVSREDRLMELRESAEELEDSEVGVAFFADSAEAARILADRGWISEKDRAQISDVVAREEPARFF